MTTKNFIFVLTGVIAIGGLFSCGGDSDFEGADEEIQEYITANNITAEMTTSGLYYTITQESTVPVDSNVVDSVAVFSNLAVANIRGTLIDGTEWLNTTTGPTFRSLLNNQDVIPGLIEGLLQFKTGSEGKIIIPPSLGFGNNEFNGIPANSVLIIEVSDLVIYEDADAHSESELSNYITDNMLTASVLRTESGLYYTMDSTGVDSLKATSSSSTVIVNYRGYLLDGTEFDANGPVTFGLNQVIAGWTEGLQLYGKGAKGTLLIPSELGYGASGNQNIPPHTPLLFDIELIDIAN